MGNEFITFKFEKPNRRFEYDEETMTLTMIDTFYVDKDDIPQIIENIDKLDDCDNE